MISHEQESLRRFLLVLCAGDASRADDIAQEALLKAYLSFERFEGRSRFSTWLFRIAHNCYFDNIRANKRNADISVGAHDKDGGTLSDNITDEEACADRRFRYEQLYMSIEKLSVHERTVILLFYMEEKSIKEIELITGMPSGTVRSHLSRGRRHLRNWICEAM